MILLEIFHSYLSLQRIKPKEELLFESLFSFSFGRNKSLVHPISFWFLAERRGANLRSNMKPNTSSLEHTTNGP